MTLSLDIYCRTSSGDSQSLPEQESTAREYAARRDLPLSGVVHTDHGKSGGSHDRPGLQAALERVRTGQSGGLVIAYQSRLTRSEDGMALLMEIVANGGAVYGPNIADDLTSADGRLQFNLTLAIDAHQRQKAAELTARGKARRVAAGVHFAPAPLGYSKDDIGRLVPNDDAGHVVRAFEMRADGAGPSEVAEYLNAAGARTARGNRYTLASVHELWQRRTYLGESSGGASKNATAHDAIVPRALWEHVQTVRSTGRRPRGTAGDGTLLTGRLRCAGCGAVLVATHNSNGTRVYRCTGRGLEGCEARARVNADVVERLATDYLLSEGRRFEEVSAGASAETLAGLERAVSDALALLDQCLSAEGQRALKTRWSAVTEARTNDLEAAQAALGAAQAINPRQGRVHTLEGLWRSGDTLSVDDRRWLLSQRFPAIQVEKVGRGRMIVRLDARDSDGDYLLVEGVVVARGENIEAAA